MLTTFTTKDGLLVIRAEDLRRIEDVPAAPWNGAAPAHACEVEWAPTGQELICRFVLGTAQENLDRIVAEEMKILATHQDMQKRAHQGLPALPVVRGGRAPS